MFFGFCHIYRFTNLDESTNRRVSTYQWLANIHNFVTEFIKGDMDKQRTVFITGATGGIGKATAIALAKENYRVVIHGRNTEKTAAVCEEIKRLSGNNKIDYIIGDLFLMNEVKKVAETFIERYEHLDILINNAGGIMSKERTETAEGVETTIAVNLLAPFLFTELLLGLLKKSNDGRIINVASNSHQLNAKPDFNDLELKSNYNPLVAY